MTLPRLEHEILLAHVFKIKRIELLAHPERQLSQIEKTLFQQLVKRRLNHEPIAYIVGYQPFMGLNFIVNQSVLIPRPETELLVEEALRLSRSLASQAELAGEPKRLAYAKYTIADIGTGSGCIAISLAKTLRGAHIFATDTSTEALKLAQRNAECHQVTDHCEFLQGNLFEPLNNVAANLPAEQAGLALPTKFDLIISNPPYIPTKDIETLDPDVKDWEPIGALDGGQDGLDYVREIIKEAPKHSNSLILEFGINQAEEIRQLAKKHYQKVEIIKDYAGINRILKAEKLSSIIS